MCFHWMTAFTKFQWSSLRTHTIYATRKFIHHTSPYLSRQRHLINLSIQKLLILLEFRLFHCLFFQWVCFLLQQILRNFMLSMYNIIFGKSFVHTLFVCHNYWENHPTPYAAHSYESLKYVWLFTEMSVHSSKNCNITITIWPGAPPKLCVRSNFSSNMNYNVYLK